MRHGRPRPFVLAGSALLPAVQCDCAASLLLGLPDLVFMSLLRVQLVWLVVFAGLPGSHVLVGDALWGGLHGTVQRRRCLHAGYRRRARNPGFWSLPLTVIAGAGSRWTLEARRHQWRGRRGHLPPGVGSGAWLLVGMGRGLCVLGCVLWC